MAKEEALEPVQFGAADLKALEDISSQLSACKSASEKTGKGTNNVLTVFLKMVDDRMTGFVREMRDRMRQVKTT